MNYIDLFHGIGGFALGAYWAGMKFENHYCSDIEPYAVELYKKRFPDSIQLGDIREIDCEKLADTERNGWIGSSGKQNDCGALHKADETEKEKSKLGRIAETISNSGKGTSWIITGGFPCQDISVAGKGTGIRGSRSGLWFEMWRIIRDLRPRFAIMENVGALTFRGLTDVLGSLAEIGYDAEWQDIRAEDMGAPHRRERIWIIAYPSVERLQERKEGKRSGILSYVKRRGAEISNSLSINDDNSRYGTGEVCRQQSEQTDISESGNWITEPAVGMLVDGLSSDMDRFEGRLANNSYKRVDQLKGLGNSIVPQIAEMLFRQIKEQI